MIKETKLPFAALAGSAALAAAFVLTQSAADAESKKDAPQLKQNPPSAAQSPPTCKYVIKGPTDQEQDIACTHSAAAGQNMTFAQHLMFGMEAGPNGGYAQVLHDSDQWQLLLEFRRHRDH